MSGLRSLLLLPLPVAWMEAMKICMTGEERVGHLGLVLRYKVIFRLAGCGGKRIMVGVRTWLQQAYIAHPM